MAAESLSFDIWANDRASETFRRLGLAASNASGDVKTLGDRLDKLGTRVSTARVGLEGNKEAGAELDKLDVKLIRLGNKVADPNITVEGKIKALADIAAVDVAMDKLNKKYAQPSLLSRSLTKAGGAGALAPSGIGIAAALSPALIPLSAGIAAGIGAITVSLGAATIGAGAFGLLAKSALTTAGTAATAVEKAQQTYNIAIATGTKHATAYAAEQRAIKLAYADLSPAQIALSKQVGVLGNAWDGVQKSLAPVVSGALVPWLGAVTDAMKLIKPFVAPIAAVFKDWGVSLQKYFSNTIVAEQLRQLAVAFGKFSASQLRDIGSFLVNIGAAIFHLGQDLSANGVNFGAFGDHLAAWGKAFDTWSKSAQARADVQGFLDYLHKNGATVRSILSDLGKILPGIFKGATTAGTLELQAIAGFLSLVASLPKGWQAPLTEAAGALLLLSKTGVVSVGLKLTGQLAKNPTALGFGIGTLLAAGIIDAVNQKRPGAGGKTWWQSFGPPSKGQQQTWLNSWSGLGDRIVQIADDVRHGVAFAWDHMWAHTIGSTDQGNHDVLALFDKLRHNVANTFDGFRHDIASAWDRIWGNTEAAVRNGIAAVVSFFRGLPGRALAALFGFGHSLYAFGHAALTELWNGIKVVAGPIVSWFGGFIGKILGFLGKLTGHSPSGEFYFAGQKMMTQLAAGIKSRAHHAANAAEAAAQRVSSGALGGDALANQALARRIFPWGADQWAPFVSLVMAESGFNRFARNPSSGAYGIAQALPPTKYPLAGQAGGGSHAGPQLSWMFSYIAQRYGNPSNAWAHELSAHWYGSGLKDGLFTRPTLIGVGERGPEMVSVTPGRTAAGGNTYVIHNHVPPNVNMAEVGRVTVTAIREFEKRSGNGWRN